MSDARSDRPSEPENEDASKAVAEEVERSGNEAAAQNREKARSLQEAEATERASGAVED